MAPQDAHISEHAFGEFWFVGVRAAEKTQRASGIELPPVASALMQSLRSVGYTAATAVADIIDNSIAARARNVWISLAPTHSPV